MATAGRPTGPAAGVNSRPARTSCPDDGRWDGLPLLLPVADAAPLLGISRYAVYRLIARDELPVRRIGPRRIYIETLRLRELLHTAPRCTAV